jgi:putative transposase
MLMVKKIHKRTAEEKEKILQDIQRLGVTLGCRKHSVSKAQYYIWLDRYNSGGLAGLEDRRKADSDAQVKRLERENRMLKELLAEKELESKMKDELLKKKFAQWEKKGK